MAWRSSVTLQDSSGRAEGQKPDFSGLRINGQWKKQKMDICNNMDWTSKSTEINWKNTYYMTAFGWNIWSDQTNLWWQQAGQCLSGTRCGEGGLTAEGHKRTFWGSGNVLWIYWGGYHTGAFLCHYSLTCILKKGYIHYIYKYFK